MAIDREAYNAYADVLKHLLVGWGDSAFFHIKPRISMIDFLPIAWMYLRGYKVVAEVPFDPKKRAEGRDVPTRGETMIGFARLDNLQYCVDTAIDEGIEGDFLEAGVWRGGASIFMKALLAARGVKDRKVWLADSFAGLPAPDPRYPADEGSELHTLDVLSVTEEQVRANFQKYGLLDENVRFLKGWFEYTLASAPFTKLAVLRLDGDMYSSTMQTLEATYDRLSPGGFCIIDDYGAFEFCRQAVDDYRAKHGITDQVHVIDWAGAYWRKSR